VAKREQEEQQKQEEARHAEEERVALEKKQAEEQQKAREEAERQRQQEEEQKRVADAKRKADEKRKAEDAKRKADDEKARAASEAELRKSLEAEERLNTLRSSSAMSSWIAQIANRIQRAWIRPPSARPGIDCVVHVTQVPGGAVTSVKVGECNGDAAVRQSIEDAVIRASPLPPPPDPALFERELDIRFKPQD
jgi:colicin import membrane protein